MPSPDAEWAEREYNPRWRVPDASRICEAWPERAAGTRRRHPPVEIRYGGHPREVMDLFRPEAARGTVMFIHGGYWRAFSKEAFSWVADGFLGQDLSVAILNYPLCPDVTLDAIVASTRRAFAHLWRESLSRAERRRIVVTGHSAGGYLSALHLATDWTEHGLPADPLAGIVPVSGVFALAPLLATTMNDAIRLDPESAGRLSLTGRPWRCRAPMTLVVGGDESGEFHRQSGEFVSNWGELAPDLVDIPGTNHFDVIDGLGQPGSRLNRIVAETIDR